jgi:hypothetical protein
MELELEQHGVGWAKARGENHPRGQNRARAVRTWGLCDSDFAHPTAARHRRLSVPDFAIAR